MNIEIKNLTASGNGEDGVRIVGAPGPVKIGNLTADGNGGQGLNIMDKPEEVKAVAVAPADPWYKKPIGTVGLSITGAALTAALVWAVNHYLG